MPSASDAEPTELPIACTLGAADGAARLRRWAALVDRFPPRAERSGNQLGIRWRLDAPGARELQGLAAAERECCSFVTWSVGHDGADTLLLITAPADRPEVLAAVASLFARQAS
jgi:hypothetical protein